MWELNSCQMCGVQLAPDDFDGDCGAHQEHDLKTLLEHFNAVERGEKTAELRRDDRGYEVHDLLVLHEWSEAAGYTGRAIYKGVSHILRGGPWLAEGYVMLSFKPDPIKEQPAYRAGLLRAAEIVEAAEGSADERLGGLGARLREEAGELS